MVRLLTNRKELGRSWVILKMLDLIGLLGYIGFYVTAQNKDLHKDNLPENLHLITVIWSVMRGFLETFRLIDETSHYIYMMSLVVRNLVSFMVIIFTTMLWNTIVFTQLDYMGERLSETSSFWDTLKSSYDLLQGEIANPQMKTQFGYFVYILVSFMQKVIILKMLVSIIANTFEEV